MAQQNGGLSNGWNATHIPRDSALSVGSSKAEEDASRIRDLEDEVRILAEKANSASQKFADYENEIRVLEAKLRQEQRKNSAVTTPLAESPESSPSTTEKPSLSRFGSFMGKRSSPAVPQVASPAMNNTREKELEEKLVKEQTTRIAAEKKVKEVSAEIEELSATLFQQANEMVATERKENAALKERIEALEAQRVEKEAQMKQAEQTQKQQERQVADQDRTPRQAAASDSSKDPGALQKENSRLKEKIRALEQRETDRKRRIERLEAANRRIERVRAMLQPP